VLTTLFIIQIDDIPVNIQNK